MANFKVEGQLTIAGASKAVGDLKQVAAAQDAVTQSAEQVTDASNRATAANDQAAQSQRRNAQASTEAASAAKTVQTHTAGQAETITAVTTAATINATAMRQVKEANDNTGKSAQAANTALSSYQKTQLGFQLNDVFTQIASGQSILRTAVQQGPQITQIFGGVGATLARIPPQAALVAAAIAATVGIVAVAGSAFADLASRNRQAEISLQATGRQAGITAGQLELLVQTEARRAGAGRNETQQAALSLFSNNQLQGDAVGRTLALARDLARVTGTDLPTAAAALSGGLDGTLAGAKKLDAAFNALTPSELEQIRHFEEIGDKGSAIGVMLTAFERNLKGANERGITPMTAAVNELGNAWTNFSTKLGNSEVVKAFVNLHAGALQGAARDINGMMGPAPGGPSSAPKPEDVAQARQALDLARKQLNDLQQLRDQATTSMQAARANQSIVAAQTRVDALTKTLIELDGKAASAANKTLGDNVASWATDYKTKVNEASAATDRFATVVAERQKLQGDRVVAQKVLDSGIASPEQMARASEVITQIDGKLRALRTPAEELQRSLDFEGRMAALPPHLQAAQRAFEETKKKALEMGQTEAQATRVADQARANVLTSQRTATEQQIQLLTGEAQAALRVADAYGTSRARAIQLQAQLKAAIAEKQGQIAPDTAAEFAQETLEQGATQAVAAAAEKNEAYQREISALDRLVEAEGKGADAAREAERANKVAALAEDLRAQAAASGSAAIAAAAEKQIAIYDRLTKAQTQSTVRREAQALNRQFDPNSAYDFDIGKLKELEATGLLTARAVSEAFKEAELKRLEGSRNATDGMIGGLKRYADEATNAGKAAGDGVKAGMRAAEDALVQFVTTGQINFQNLANAIIADLARIAIRQAITGPIAAGLGSAFGNWFGGGGKGNDPGTIDYGGGSPEYGYFHGGGIVGESATFTRAVDPMVFANAPRFHTGGLVAGERAIIAKDDEEVLTSDNPRHRWNIGRGGGDYRAGGSPAAPVMQVIINNNTDAKASTRQGTSPEGMPTLEVFFDQAEEHIAGNLMRSRGAVHTAMTSKFGLSPVGS